jgi:L-alanine-DL-glutamate epimerase-like enolase superfamily enzyme
LRESLIDILRPDISREGISRCRRIAALAEPIMLQSRPVMMAARLQQRTANGP